MRFAQHRNLLWGKFKNVQLQ